MPVPTGLNAAMVSIPGVARPAGTIVVTARTTTMTATLATGLDVGTCDVGGDAHADRVDLHPSIRLDGEAQRTP